MKIVAWILAVILVGLGIVFLAGSQGLVLRLVLGGVLMAAGIVLVAVVHLKPRVEQRVARVELTGDVRLQALACEKCGGHLDERSVSVQAGAVFVSCPWCKASYQLEEAPKW